MNLYGYMYEYIWIMIRKGLLRILTGSAIFFETSLALNFTFYYCLA